MIKILVIDDEFYVRKTTTKVLESNGYITLSAEEGMEGIEIAKKETPDLIISDINMPNMDGFEVLLQLRKDPKTALIPFIFLSAKSESADLRSGMELGADDYLTKPFVPEQLLKAVKIRIEKSKNLKNYSEEKLNELRNNISLSLPHEVFTPLNSILGLSSLVCNYSDEMDIKDIIKMCETIHDSGNRLHNTLKNFVYYANLLIKKNDPNKLSNFMTGYMDNAKLFIETHATVISKEYKRENDLVMNLADASLSIKPEVVQKILTEILSNAFKFSQKGTKISISTSNQNKVYSIKTQDMGRGMTTKQMASIEAYIQFERDVYEQQGCGLGLAITKLLVEIHKGSITFESKPEEYTIVTVSLPLVV